MYHFSSSMEEMVQSLIQKTIELFNMINCVKEAISLLDS